MMNSAGRADKHNLLRALTLYGLILTIISLILVITYKYYTAKLDILRLDSHDGYIYVLYRKMR